MPPPAIPIHSRWRFHGLNDKRHPRVEQWRPAEVPGLVQMERLRIKVIPDPYYRKSKYHYGGDWSPRYVAEDIWLPVKLIAWDDLRIDNFHIRQERISQDEAQLWAEFDIVAAKSGAVSLAVEHDGATGKKVA